MNVTGHITPQAGAFGDALMQSEARAHTLAVHDGSGRIKLHLAVGHVKGMNIALQSKRHGEHYVVYVCMILTDRLGLGTFRSWWFIWRAWAASLDPVKDV